MMNKTDLVNLRDREGDNYDLFLNGVKNHFSNIVKEHKHLFNTNTEGLWEAFLYNIEGEEARQHYNCRTCRHFIERYGSLVIITNEGEIKSAIWGEYIPECFKASVDAMKELILKSRVSNVFYSGQINLGTSECGGFNHLSVQLPRELVFRGRIKNAEQEMAEKSEDYRTLRRGLVDFSIETVQEAISLLETETLYRGERCLGIAQWLYDLHTKIVETKNRSAKENLIWLEVAKVSQGYSHIRGGMIGTLLEDIKSGMDFETVKRRFDEKMGNYMRSQSAPSKGNIDRAEKIVAELGISDSLRRRYATFEEVPCTIWKDKRKEKYVPEKKITGVFSSVIPKENNSRQSDDRTLPTSVMTWEKFKRTMLHTANSLEVKVDNTDRLMALVTSSVEDSENILQWNNPFSWYYHGGIDGEIKRRVENAGGRYENNEIRCSLMWDTENYTDLDLHCVTPYNEHIYFSRKRSISGYLDLDMNGIDKKSKTPVENMRWKSNAPEGRYRFYVNNFNEKDNYRGTPFKIELEVNGKIYTYHGKPLRNKESVDVFEFDYVKGQQPIIQSEDSYVSDSNWNISVNKFVKVNGITDSPNLWGEKPLTQFGTHVFFLLDDCKDLSEGKGRGFFNEMLKSELHEVRKTLEAFTASTPIEGSDIASACGVGFNSDSEWNLLIKVNGNRIIKIDRWD